MNRRGIREKGCRVKAAVAMFLVLVLSLSPCFSWFRGVGSAEAATFKIRKFRKSSIIKDAYFDFYGTELKSDMLYWIKSDGSPIFCIQKNKQLISDLYGGELAEEFGSSRYLNKKQYELVSLVLQSCGMIRGQSVQLEPGTYLAGQAAVWGITSYQQWQGTDHYRREMEKVYDYIEDWEEFSAEEILEKAQEAVDSICEAIDSFYGDQSPYLPAFASKYKEKAPVWEASCQEDGSCETTFFLDGRSDAVKNFIFEMPEGWTYEWQGEEITFRCESAEDGLIDIVGRPEEGSLLEDAMPIGLVYIVGPVNFYQLQRLASEVECTTSWNCYFKLKVIKPEPSGSWYLPSVQRYQHRETFDALYGAGVEKLDSKTLEPLAGAEFQPLVYFDKSQLEATRLDKQQIKTWDGWKEVGEPITTDRDGKIEHWDKREYFYEKTYCGGHPQPEINDEGSSISHREQLEKEAQEAWEQEVKACERVCDFHSVDGTGQEMLKEDREITYQQFIHLVYGYSFREIKPPSGYVLPETSEEGKAGRQVFFDSLQAGGNIQERKETEPKVSKHDVALVRAVREGTASSCDAEGKITEHREEEREEIIETGKEDKPKKEEQREETEEQREETKGQKEETKEQKEETKEQKEEQGEEPETGSASVARRQDDGEEKTARKKVKPFRAEENYWLKSLIEPMDQEWEERIIVYQFSIKNDRKSTPEESTPEETMPETSPEEPPEETLPETSPGEPPEETLPEETLPELPAPEETLPQETPSGSHSSGGPGGRKWKAEVLPPSSVPETSEVFLLPEAPIPQAVSRMGWIEANYATPSVVRRVEKGGKNNVSSDVLPKTGDPAPGLFVLLLLFAGSGGGIIWLIKKRRAAAVCVLAVVFCIPWAGESRAEEKTMLFQQLDAQGFGAWRQEDDAEEIKKTLYFPKKDPSSGEETLENGAGDGLMQEVVTDEDGRQYRLESCQLVDVFLPEKEEWVTEEVEYLAVEKEGQIPPSLEFERKEEETGRKGEGRLFCSEVSASEFYWDEGFQVALRFYDYNADTYQLQGREIPREKALEYLLENPQMLLEAVGCTPAGYQLDGIIWNGDSYMLQETLCRDALAYGKRLVYDCTAEYTGRLVYPEGEQAMWEAVYTLVPLTAPLPVAPEEETEILPEAEETAAARPVLLPEKKSFFWMKLRTIAFYSVSLVILFPAAVYFILLAGRRKRLSVNK